MLPGKSTLIRRLKRMGFATEAEGFVDLARDCAPLPAGV